MFNKDDYRAVLQNLPEGVEEAEVNVEYHCKLSVCVSDNWVVGTEASSMTEVFARASGMTTGYAYTQNLEEPGKQVILRAYQNGLTSDTGVKDIIGNRDESYPGCAHSESFHETLKKLEDVGAYIEKK